MEMKKVMFDDGTFAFECEDYKKANVNLELVEEVLDFIDETINLFEQTPLYTKFDVSAEEYFCRGGCGHFYTILKAQFPQANPYVTERASHVLTEIDGVLYDVRGIVDDFEPATDEPIPDYMVKFVTNYAYSLKSDWGRGPTSICNILALESMTLEEREKTYTYLDSIGGCADGYRAKLNEYMSNDPYTIRKLKREAEGIFYPFVQQQELEMEAM